MGKRLSRKERRKIVEESLGIGEIPWDKFTSGVYNYCDRWCEKCDPDKKERCFLFYSEEKEETDCNDPNAALNHMGKSFSKTHDLIEKIAEAEGLNLEITKSDEKEFEKFERLTNPSKELLYLSAKEITDSAAKWLLEVPSLDFADYRESYDKLSWHHSLVLTKVYRSLFSKKEADIEKENMKKFSLEDSKNSAWVALRSAKICKNSLELMDRFVRNARIKEMAAKYDELIQLIEETLLT